MMKNPEEEDESRSRRRGLKNKKLIKIKPEEE